MLKKLYKIIFFMILILIISNAACFSAPVYDYEHGRFELLLPESSYSSLEPSDVVQTQDGHVYLRYGLSIIEFMPQTNTFEKIATLDSCQFSELGIADSVLLNNGKMLFLAPYTTLPSELFYNEIYKILSNNNIPALHGVTFRRRLYNYYKMSESEKIGVLLPYIKKDPDLYKRYREYAHCFNESMYGQIFDPVTRTFEKTGKVKVRRNETQKILLKNNKVLIVDGVITDSLRRVINFPRATQFEIFDPDTKEFKLLDLSFKEEDIRNVILLNNGKVLISAYSGVFIFDPETNKIEKVNSSIRMWNDAIKLHGIRDIIVYIDRIDWSNKKLHIYDVEKNTVTEMGDYLVYRGDINCITLTLLPDNNILVSGGDRDFSVWQGCGLATPEKKVELFSTKTGQAKLIPSRISDTFSYNTLVLNDGRVIFWSREPEIYIPKGYDRKD